MVDRLVVVHVVPFYPPHQGGMEHAAERLVTLSAEHGIESQVLTADLGGPAPAGEDPRRVQRLRSIEIAHTPVIWGLWPALRRTPASAVVHAHVAQAFVPDLAIAVARRRGQPALAHYHLDVDPTGVFGVLLRPYQRTLLRRTLNRCDVVVVPTADYVDIVAGTYGVPRSRIRIVPNGTDFPVAAQPRQAPGGDWRLISVGRLSPQKQYPLLFAACRELREQHPELRWTLDVFGDGELRQELEREIDRHGLRGLVTLRGGDLTRAELQAEYDRADLFALATRKESFGIVFAEAMARGLPVVTTDAPGVRNVVQQGHNGWLAGQQAPAFAAALAQAMTDPAAYQRVSAANLVDARAFTWTCVAEQFAALYRELASGGVAQAPGRAGTQ